MTKTPIQLDDVSPIADVLACDPVVIPCETDHFDRAIRLSLYEVRTGEQTNVVIPYEAACELFERLSKALAVLHG